MLLKDMLWGYWNIGRPLTLPSVNVTANLQNFKYFDEELGLGGSCTEIRRRLNFVATPFVFWTYDFYFTEETRY